MKRAAGDHEPEEEVERARAQMKAGLLMGLESPSNRAERLARMLQIWGRVPDLEETVERIDAVTLAECAPGETHGGTRDAGAMALYGPVEAAPALRRPQDRARPDAAAAPEGSGSRPSVSRCARPFADRSRLVRAAPESADFLIPWEPPGPPTI